MTFSRNKIAWGTYAKLALVIAVLALLLIPLLEGRARDLLHREPTVRLLFTGDGMFDRTVRTAGEANGYAFLLEPLAGAFAKHDAVVMNVEGPITTYPTVSVFTKAGDPSNTRFTFSPAVVPVLKDHNVIAHLGNNHIWDYGKEGIRQTKQSLEREGVAYFGDSGSSAESTLVHEIEGIRFGFVSYNEFAAGSRARALESLRVLEGAVDFTVLYAHWGDEYHNIPRPDQVVLARDFKDAGADLIVGSHSHTVQASEKIDDVPVYYSLGNLVFDQYFEKAVRCGALLSVEIKGEAVTSHELIPVSLKKTRQTTLEACE